ncbi:MAG: exosortase/archaeosortase family protein [bacterium]|nr:exosortase/archaeosortase family protein [bacterium]
MKKELGKLGLAALLVGVIYYPTGIWLVERYVAADTYYSHGFLVPLVSGYFIWLAVRKNDSASLITHSQGNLWGLGIILVALGIHMLSMLMEVYFVSGYSLFILVFGVTIFLYGWDFTKKILFPLSFLFFMFPLPLVAINAVSLPLKNIATKAAVLVMKYFMHLPVRNEGFEIIFPKVSLVVDNPCSGLRSLISMLALGSIFAYLLKDKVYKRISLILLAIPVALGANSLRNIILSTGVFIYGKQILDTFFHGFVGYVIFLLEFWLLWYVWGKMKCQK